MKNKDIMNFTGKQMELENIILSEVTQTLKTLMVCPHLEVDIRYKKQGHHEFCREMGTIRN